MIYIRKLILSILTFLPIKMEIMNPNVFCLKKDKPFQSFYEGVSKLEIRSIVFIFDDAQKFPEFLVELHQSVPIYTMSLREQDLNTIYSQDHEIYFDNLKLFIVYQTQLNPQTINTTIEYIKKLRFWKIRDKIIFLTNSTLTNAMTTNLFEFCFRNWILNAVLVPANQCSEVYSFNAYGNNFVKLQQALSFKDNFRNLNGFEINISLFHEPVYARKKGKYFTGRDGEMAKTIVSVMNATYRYVMPEDGDDFGAFNETFMSGAARDVILNITQIGLNSRLLVDHYNKVEFTHSHDRDDLVILIPKSMQPKTLIQIIPSLIWFTWGILAIFIFLFLAAQTTSDYCNILLVTILILTGRSVKELRMKYFRVMYMSVMVIVIFTNTIICCNITSFSTVPKFQKEIETLKQFVNTNYNIATTSKFETSLHQDLEEDVKGRILSKIKFIKVSRQIQEILKCKHQAVICKNGLAREALEKGGKKCYTKLKQHLLPSLVSYIVGYGSPLLPRLNRIIRRTIESGLNQYWGPHLPAKMIEEQHTKMSLDFLLIAFQIYIGGIVLSSIGFVSEIVFGKYIKKINKRIQVNV